MQYIEHEIIITVFDSCDSFVVECASYNEGGMSDKYSIEPDLSDI